jgi:MOSC domain-containing protein YiiM
MKKGRIFQINVSDGGVPKQPVRNAELTVEGLEGDRQRDLAHHGGPKRALCLYSLERIQELQEKGHPIFPGATGENLTLSGLKWDKLVPGTVLYLGSKAVIEITGYTKPHENLIAAYFKEGKSDRILHEKHPGWARLYAKVLKPGVLYLGDEVSIKKPKKTKK